MPLPDVLLLAAAVYGLNVSGAAAQYLYCTGIDTHGHLTFSSVQPGQVGPGGSSTLTANSAGTLWTLTETSGSAGPWTNATLFGQYNDGGSPPTSCGVTIAPPALQRFQPTTQPQVDEDGYTLARDETDAALLSQSYATTTGVKASNLPGDYFNNTEQSELAAAAAIAPPSAAAIATAVAADILETPANKLATDTSGDVELVSAEQSELAAAAAISPPSPRPSPRRPPRPSWRRRPTSSRPTAAATWSWSPPSKANFPRRGLCAAQRRDHRRRRGGGRAHAQRDPGRQHLQQRLSGRRRGNLAADGQHRRYQRQRGGSGRGLAIDLVAYQNCALGPFPITASASQAGNEFAAVATALGDAEDVLWTLDNSAFTVSDDGPRSRSAATQMDSSQCMQCQLFIQNVTTKTMFAAGTLTIKPVPAIA